MARLVAATAVPATTSARQPAASERSTVCRLPTAPTTTSAKVVASTMMRSAASIA
jgi:hypothetical protein